MAHAPWYNVAVHTSAFFKLFPPPKFLLMSHAGLDISDDAVRFIQYSRRNGSFVIAKYGHVDLPPGLVESGDVKDEKKFGDILAGIAREHGISYAKISIPEEKAYLFETDVPSGDYKAVNQNIEFKLEENIPLAAPDAVFAFDLLPTEAGKPRRASVSAIPKSYIERMMKLLNEAGIIPLAFETAPRAIARIVSDGVSGASIVIHAMSRKTGVYVVSGSAVGFTSTIAAGAGDVDAAAYVTALAAEVRQVYTYWLSRGDTAGAPLKSVTVVGVFAERTAPALRGKVSDILPVTIADVWREVFRLERYVPPITREDSLEYAPAAGLAM